MSARICGTRRGDFMDVSGTWSSNGRHVNVLSIQYAVYNCDTGALAWYDYISYENNPAVTSGGRNWSVYINSQYYHQMRVTGGGDLQEPFGNGYLTTMFSRYPPPNTPAFISYSGCF